MVETTATDTTGALRGTDHALGLTRTRKRSNDANGSAADGGATTRTEERINLSAGGNPESNGAAESDQGFRLESPRAETVNPATLGTTPDKPRRRGRPRGAGKPATEEKPAAVDLTDAIPIGLKPILLSIHALLAELTATPEMELDETEAEQLSGSIR